MHVHNICSVYMGMQTDMSLFIICELSLMLVVDVLFTFLPDIHVMMYPEIFMPYIFVIICSLCNKVADVPIIMLFGTL